MFQREIRTRPLDEEDYEILKGSVRIVDEDGTEHHPTLEEMRELGMDRVVASRNILTGEWQEKVQAKTHEGDPLPYFVVKAG